jgi:hypothetical protein
LLHRHTDLQLPRKYKDTKETHGFLNKREIQVDSGTSHRLREELFDHRSLSTTAEALSNWPLSQYLWAAVLQAAHLDRLRQTSAWDFGRLAKAHPLLFSLDENPALTKI